MKYLLIALTLLCGLAFTATADAHGRRFGRAVVVAPRAVVVRRGFHRRAVVVAPRAFVVRQPALFVPRQQVFVAPSYGYGFQQQVIGYGGCAAFYGY